MFGKNKKKEKNISFSFMGNWAVCVFNILGRYVCHGQRCLQPHASPGLLLQSCLSGYYRVDGILFGGICQPCECHGHAAECDIHGVCFVSLSQTWATLPAPAQSQLLCRSCLFFLNDSSAGEYLCPWRPQRKSADLSSCHKIFPDFPLFGGGKYIHWW